MLASSSARWVAGCGAVLAQGVLRGWGLRATSVWQQLGGILLLLLLFPPITFTPQSLV